MPVTQQTLQHPVQAAGMTVAVETAEAAVVAVVAKAVANVAKLGTPAPGSSFRSMIKALSRNGERFFMDNIAIFKV